MFSKNAFRAYDIRGVYPKEVNSELAKKVAIVLSSEFFGEGVVVVGRDIRIGSKEMYEEAISAFKGENREVVEVGIITTPMLTFLVNDLDAAGGIMVTASHNPKEYNGIKMVKEKAAPIGGAEMWKKIYG